MQKTPPPSFFPRVGVLGVTGRMGQALVKALHEQESSLIFAGGLLHHKSYTGHPLSPATLFASPSLLFESSDVVVDFTHYSQTNHHVNWALSYKKPFFLGTTGLEKSQWSAVKNAAQTIPIFQTFNTSFGVFLLEKMLEGCAPLLKDFSLHIEDIHHQHKKDSPSGTALMLGNALRDAPSAPVYSSVRRGNVCGQHTVVLAAPQEKIVFSHEALSSDLFAKGALKIAQWLVQQPPGLYHMEDFVLSSHKNKITSPL